MKKRPTDWLEVAWLAAIVLFVGVLVWGVCVAMRDPAIELLRSLA